MERSTVLSANASSTSRCIPRVRRSIARQIVQTVTFRKSGNSFTAKYDGVNRAESRSRQNRYYSFGNQGHVDDDRVALAHAHIGQRSSQQGRFVQKLVVRYFADRRYLRTVVNQCHFVPISSENVSIHRIVTGVQFSAYEPAERTYFYLNDDPSGACEITDKQLLPFRKRLFRVIQHLVPRFAPIYAPRHFSPKTFRILQGFLVSFVVPRTGNVMGIDDVIYTNRSVTRFRGENLFSRAIFFDKKATRSNDSERTNYR